ncbi:MAG: hypothetical protein M0R17_10980 [Candidatus Omnitrophica bacterium]|nr:hypothetical protein [Candidatus Omnitrophota bacterium]
MEKQREKIIKEYRKKLLTFLIFNIYLAISVLFFVILIKDNRLNLDFYELLLCVIVFLVLLFKVLSKSVSNDMLLTISGLCVWAYFLSYNETLFMFAELFLTISVIYEIIIRFWIGVEIEPRFKELSWYISKNKK